MLICILALSLVFTPYLSNAVVSAKSPHFFHALVVLKLLVSLISRLVACSARIVVDKQTDRQTHRPTTVTLAAHARRGLISQAKGLHFMIKPYHCNKAFSAGKKGHLAKVCWTKQRENVARGSRNQVTRPPSRPRLQNQATHHVGEDDEEPEYVDNKLNIPEKRVFPLTVEVQLNKVKLRMEVDTGALASIKM